MSFTPLALNVSDSYPIFRKTPTNCGDKVEIRPLFRKLNKRAPEKFHGGKVWALVAVAAAGNDRLEYYCISNQGSPNTQTLPTLILFLPIQMHGSWCEFFAELSLEFGDNRHTFITLICKTSERFERN